MPAQSNVTSGLSMVASRRNLYPVCRASSANTSLAGFRSTFKVTRRGSPRRFDSRRSRMTCNRRVASGSAILASAAFKSGMAASPAFESAAPARSRAW